MHEPQATEPGTAAPDLEWAARAERHVLFALLAMSALGWLAYALLTTTLLYPLLTIRALVVGICLVVATAFLLAFPARAVLYRASRRYRRAKRCARARARKLPHTPG